MLSANTFSSYFPSKFSSQTLFLFSDENFSKEWKKKTKKDDLDKFVSLLPFEIHLKIETVGNDLYKWEPNSEYISF